jgi:hypothetical protein
MKKFLITMTFVLFFSSFASANTVDDAITWMYDNDLTIYDNKIDFNANKWLRRDEAAKFYVNFAKLLGKTTYIKTANQCSFSDINDSWSDLKDIVIESCRLGLFQGSKGKFSPKSQLTNAQAITVLVRLLSGNQNEAWQSHRANNYYTKADELGILQNIAMDSKDNIATRGNVWIIIYNSRNITEFNIKKLWLVGGEIWFINDTYNISVEIWNGDADLPINWSILVWEYKTFHQEDIIIECKNLETNDTIKFSVYPKADIEAWKRVFADWNIEKDQLINRTVNELMCRIDWNSGRNIVNINK